jgi:hypothetical protein
MVASHVKAVVVSRAGAKGSKTFRAQLISGVFGVFGKGSFTYLW